MEIVGINDKGDEEVTAVLNTELRADWVLAMIEHSEDN